ncbi:hypothetical protein F2Q70_00037126 [Brassica cretica]|uniref:Uncharacterized protein n=1 Tax=Brassica cretica TaxID=69181 RepID=A0A8S9JXH1_BRACR|nr:hypothetical protein F2Q70_00037126 [Brassica cretica]
MFGLQREEAFRILMAFKKKVVQWIRNSAKCSPVQINFLIAEEGEERDHRGR